MFTAAVTLATPAETIITLIVSSSNVAKLFFYLTARELLSRGRRV